MPRFSKGQSGNPGGRPPGSKSVDARFREFMDREASLNDPSGKPLPAGHGTVNLDLVFKAVLTATMELDMRAAKLVFDRIAGRPALNAEERPVPVRDGQEAPRRITIPDADDRLAATEGPETRED